MINDCLIHEWEYLKFLRRKEEEWRGTELNIWWNALKDHEDRFEKMLLKNVSSLAAQTDSVTK